VSALATIYNNYRDGHLLLTLQTLRDCFGTEQSPPNHLILGFGQFLSWYSGEYDTAHLLKRMRQIGLSGLRMETEKRRLLDRVTSREAVGMAVVNFYNHKLPPERRLLAWETVAITRKGAKKLPSGGSAA
jgi:hypothetical protein